MNQSKNQQFAIEKTFDLAPTTILGEMPTLETFFNYVSSTEDEFQEIVKNTIKPFILGRESYETQTYNKTAL